MFCVKRLVGKSLYIIRKSLLNTFAVMVLNADNVKGILLQFLLDKLVEFAVVFNLTVYPFEFVRINVIRQRERYF